MTTTMVDSSVLLDVLSDHGPWTAWSDEALKRASNLGQLVINPVIFGEVATRFSSIELLDEALPREEFRRDAVPWQAAFLAGKAHAAYRSRGGSRAVLLPDFLIGAHAAVSGMQVLTRDPRRFRTAYPRLRLLAPGQ